MTSEQFSMKQNSNKVGEVGMIWSDDTEKVTGISREEKYGISTITYVDIVRCKDCKHGEPGACGDGIDCDGVWHDDEWFCADGVRQE